MIEAWVLDRKNDSGSLPGWLIAAVRDRTEDGLLVLASRAGTVEARPGDLVLWDGERIDVYKGQRVGARSERPPAGASRRPSAAADQRSKGRPRRRLSLALVFAVIVFLGLLAFGYAWLMIRLMGHVRPHY
ncbi:MAG TPA: hypothetical protein VKU03_11115 [Roseiarcus sp.]|nr:hypothetical protein [Roseiarcus sp.]